jgi:hypothetical protein
MLAISHKQRPGKDVLIALFLVHPVILFLSLLDGVGGAGQFAFLANFT